MISEAIRIFSRRIRVIFRDQHRFNQDSATICRNIIDLCWNERYLRTTAGGNYNFYSRDFGMCADALVGLGYRMHVIKTLNHVLNLFRQNKGIYVAVTRSDVPFNFPNLYSPDSVAYIFRALRIAKDKSLILKHKIFLNAEIERFERTVLDKELGIVKDEQFSGMRDYAIVKRSCYDMIMACLVCDEIDKINMFMQKNVLKNRLRDYGLKKNLIKYYWNPKGYFNNSIDDKSITSHCNIFPYWLGIINDKMMIKRSLDAIEKEGLLKPLPAKYSNSEQRFIWQEIFVPNWETKAVWSWLGMTYIGLLLDIDRKKARNYLSEYTRLIEKNGFVELYDEKLRPYKSLFFIADNTMIWASLYLYNVKQRWNK